MAVNGTPRGSATESFHAAITVLGAWVAERGTADVPSRASYAGFALGRWTARCRAGYHAGTLTATEVATLQAVVGWTGGSPTRSGGSADSMVYASKPVPNHAGWPVSCGTPVSRSLIQPPSWTSAGAASPN